MRQANIEPVSGNRPCVEACLYAVLGRPPTSAVFGGKYPTIVIRLTHSRDQTARLRDAMAAPRSQFAHSQAGGPTKGDIDDAEIQRV
jgi:hypothetical protein